MGKKSRDESNDDPTAIENALYTIKFMGVFYCISSLGCFGCGAMTLWFTQLHMVFPYNTASGIWTGILTFVIFILGCRLIKLFSVDRPEDTRRLMTAYYTCTIMDLTCSILHVTYSAIGYQYCKYELRTGQQHCFLDEMPRLMLMGGFSMAFGLVIFLLSLFGTIYISTGKRLQKLTGSPIKESNEIQGCEVQGNCCV